MNFINQLLGIFLKKEYSSFKDNIWSIDLADMQLISKYNKGIRHLIYSIDLFSKYAFAVDLFSKYAFVVPLKDKKKLLLLMHFKAFWTVQKESQIEYRLIKVVSFTIVLLKNG